MLNLVNFTLGALPSCLPAVSSRDDQPHTEVGGCVEGAGLPGTQRFLRRARGEWTLSEICPLGTAWRLFLALSIPRNSDIFVSCNFVSSEYSLVGFFLFVIF